MIGTQCRGSSHEGRAISPLPNTLLEVSFGEQITSVSTLIQMWFYSCWPASIPQSLSLLVFLPLSTNTPLNTVREKEDSVAILAGKQKPKKNASRFGTVSERMSAEHTGTGDGEMLGQEQRLESSCGKEDGLCKCLQSC